MKVFICWSGEPSRQLAECVRDWLPNIIQSAAPYFAPEDTDKGSRWLPNISKELADSHVGLICVTPNNLGNEWIHFELLSNLVYGMVLIRRRACMDRCDCLIRFH